MQTVSCNNENIPPLKIVCIGRNYAEHARELGNEVPSSPVIFMKPNSSITQSLASQHNEEVLHYETELSFLIKNKKIAAVGLGLDLTKRKTQAGLKEKSLPWERAKAFDGSALFSDFVDLPDSLEQLTFTLTVDGELKQKGEVTDMVFSPQAVLDECASFMSLDDGDIIMTGTPKGVGELTAGSTYEAALYFGENRLLSKTWIAQ